MNDTANLYFDLLNERANDPDDPADWLEMNVLIALANYHLYKAGEPHTPGLELWVEDIANKMNVH